MNLERFILALINQDRSGGTMEVSKNHISLTTLLLVGIRNQLLSRKEYVFRGSADMVTSLAKCLEESIREEWFAVGPTSIVLQREKCSPHFSKVLVGHIGSHLPNIVLGDLTPAGSFYVRIRRMLGLKTTNLV